MKFKITDINGWVWSSKLQDYAKFNSDAHIFNTFAAAASLAKRRKLYGTKHEPCAVIITPCDEGGNTL